MLFDQNDMNQIHLGNYEEFFILYMDNELSEEQMKMVDAFLEIHPDLKAEFEILMNTKLPIEEISFGKEDLLSDKMKLASVDDELLLYIDNELSADQKNKVELELAFNEDYRLQHQLLLQTKLDPSEKIIYPSKKELYRRTGKVVVLRTWIRVAAAVVIIAAAGLLYFRNNSSTAIDTPVKIPATAQTGAQKSPEQKVVTDSQTSSKNESAAQNLATASASISSETKNNRKDFPKRTAKENKVDQKLVIAPNQPQENTADLIKRTKVNDIAVNTATEVALVEPKVPVNKVDVTSSSLVRLKSEPPVDPNGPIANSDRKGSVKGFLRKATRVIEKRTGFDPTNENGELLIGAVAISLK